MRYKLTTEKEVICNGDLIVPQQKMRSEVIKNVHNDIHCEITTTQKKIEIRSWVAKISKRRRTVHKKCPKCTKMKNFQQKNNTHSWSTVKELWNRVHKDHAYINGKGLLLILEDSFSGWPKVFCVRDRKTEMRKQILQVIFSTNGALKTL